MAAVARLDAFHQQMVRPRQRRKRALQVQQRRQGLHLRRIARVGEHRFHLAAQRRRQRHAPAHPFRHHATAALGHAHVGGHVFQAHQFQQAAGELEAVAAAQAADELFFHRAQPPAAQELHAHAAVAGDRADGQPVPQRDASVDHAVQTLVVAYHLGSPDNAPARCRLAR